MGVRNNDLDFSSFDEEVSKEEPSELVYDFSVFDKTIKKKEPSEISSPILQDGELKSTTSTTEEPKDLISKLLKKKRLKKEALDEGVAVVSAGTGGAGVSVSPNVQKIQESLDLGKNISASFSLKDEDQDKLIDELNDLPSEEERAQYKNPDGSQNLTFTNDALSRLREQNPNRYKELLNYSKVYSALNNIDKELGRKYSLITREINPFISDDQFKNAQLRKSSKDRQNELIASSDKLSDEQKKKIINYNNEIYSALSASSIADDESSKKYLSKKLLSSSAELDVVPTAANLYNDKKLYEGEDIDTYPIQSIEKFVDQSNPADVRAMEVYKYKRAFNEAVKTSPNIEEAAIKYVSTIDPLIGQQREKLKEDGRDLPEESRAEYVKSFLDDPRSQELAQADPNFRVLYTQAKNGFNIKYPKYAVKRIAEVISQAREDRGYNNILLNIPTESGTRELVDDLVKEGKFSQADKQLYYKELDPQIGVGKSLLRGTLGIPFGAFTGESPFKTPGVFENALTSFQKTTRDMARTVEDIPVLNPLAMTDAYRLESTLTDDARTLRLNLTKAHEISEGTGHLIGFTVPMIFGGGGLKALGAGEKAAHLINTGLMFEGQNRDKALKLFPDNPIKRLAFTTLSTAGDMFLMELIPSKAIRQGISNVLKKDVAEVTERLINKEITPQIAEKTLLEKTMSYLPKLAVENLKTASTMTGFGIYHNAVESLFGVNNLSSADILLQGVKDFKHTYLTTPILSMLSLKGGEANRKVDSRILMEMAASPEGYRKRILDFAEKNNEPKDVTEEKLRNLENASVILKDINKTDLSQSQKEKYFIYAVAEKALRDEATKTTDSNLKKKYIDEANSFSNVKEKILSGEDKATEFNQYEPITKDDQREINTESDNAVKRSMGEGELKPEELKTEEGVQEGVEGARPGETEGEPAVLKTVFDIPEVKEQIEDIKKRIEAGGVDGEKAKSELELIQKDPAEFFEQRKKESIESIKQYPLTPEESGIENITKNYDNLINRIKSFKPELEVTKAEEKVELTGVEEAEAVKQMKPITDEMVKVEREFENNGFKIDTDYDNEIIVTDKNGEIVEAEDLPDNLRKMAADYEAATSKLGEFSDTARETALAESRKVTEVTAEEVKPEELPEEEKPAVYTADNLDQVSTEGLDKTQAKVVGDVKNVVKAVSNIVKETTGNKLSVSVHTSPSTYSKAVIEAGGTRQDASTKGFYLDKNGTIHLNMDKVTSETMLHEGFHPILDFMEVNNPKLVETIYDQLNSFSEGQRFIESNKRRYTGEVTQKKEAITDFIAHVADGSIVINPSNFAKIKKFIIDSLNKLGFDLKSFKTAEIKDASELVNLTKLISEKFKAGEEITIEDVKGINEPDIINGDVVATAKVPKSIKEDKSNPIQYSSDIDKKLEREGILDEAKRGKLSDISGQYITTTMSDKAMVGKAKYKSISYDKQGGVLYPLLMKKLGLNRVWASLAKSKMTSLLDNLKVNEDGYSYIGIMAMGKTSHMSNIDAFNFTFDIIETELRDRKSGLTKEVLINEINKAYEKKYKVGKSIAGVVGKPKLSNNMSIDQIKKTVLENISKNKKAAFELRRSFLESLLGKAETKSRLKTVPNYNEVAKMMEEPLIANVGNGDVVAYMKVKKEDLKVIKTSPSEIGHHNSYEYAIESSSPFEYVLLDNPVHVSEIYPEFINKSGNKVSFEEAKARYGEEKAKRTHGRNVILSTPAEQVPESPKTKEGKPQWSREENGEEDIVTASVNVAPLYSTKVGSADQAITVHESELYKKYKQRNEDVAKMFNLEVVSQEDGVGGYEFSNGEAVMEATTVINVKGKFSDIVEYAAMNGALTPEVQDATIAGMYVKKGSEFHNADKVEVKIDNVDAAMKAAKDAGFDKAGFTLVDGEISFFNVFYEKDPEKQAKITKQFEDNLVTFVNKYEEYGGKVIDKNTSAVRSEYIDNVRRREILDGIESKAISGGQDRAGFRDALATAKERNTRYTTWKYLDKSETAKQYRSLRQKQFDLAADGKSLSDAERNRMSELEKRMAKLLTTTFKTESELSAYDQAKSEVDQIASDVAKLVEDGYKSEFPTKRPTRAAIKTVRWYSSQPNLLGDGARTNVIVNTDADANFLFNELTKRFPSAKGRVEATTTELGYPKRLMEIRTSNGKLAEIQVMTPQGYLAKDGIKDFPKDAQEKAQKSLDETRERLGWDIPDGVGHYFYEINRDVNVPKKLRDQAAEISRKYYDAFTNPESKLTDAEFREDVSDFKSKVDEADKTKWDEGNNGTSPETLNKYLEEGKGIQFSKEEEGINKENIKSINIKETKELYKGLPVSSVSGTGFHMTNAEPSSIIKEGFTVPLQGKAKFGYGAYFTIEPKKTSFGKNMIGVDISGLKMIDLSKGDVQDNFDSFNKVFLDKNGGIDYEKLTKELKENGFDGVVTDNEMVVFDPSKIKNIREIKSELPTKGEIKFSREEKEGEPEPKRVGLSKAEIAKQVEEFSMLPPERMEKVTDAELDDLADAAISSGYDVQKLVDRLRSYKGNFFYDPTSKQFEKGELAPANPLEVTILNKYAAALNADLEKNISQETLKKYTEVMDAARKSYSLVGSTLRQAKRSQALVDNLANFLVDKEVAQGAPLTENQLKVEEQKYNELKKEKEDLAKQLEIEKERNIQLAAELEKKRVSKKTGRVRTESEYKSERKNLIESAKEALLKLKEKAKGEKGGSEQYSREEQLRRDPTTNLMAIAPMVKDMMKVHIDQKIEKLEDIVNAIHSDLKELEELTGGVSKAQIIEIIGKRHDAPPVSTRNELASKIRLIRREADLLLDLADARKGLESAKREKNDKKEIQSNKRIKDLENKLAEVKKISKESQEMDQEVGELTNDKRLAKKQKLLLKRLERLEDAVDNKEYLEPQKELPPLKLNEKTKALIDRVTTLENKIKDERIKDILSKDSKGRAFYRKAMHLLGIKRIMQTSFDLSVSFRQGATMLQPTTIKQWGKSFWSQLLSAKSQSNYNELMFKIRNSKDYHEMVEDGIVFNDLETPNEDFSNASFIKKVPGIKASQRAADGFLNTARYELYMKFKNNLERQGITRQSDPKAYKDAAKWAMNMTGRGNLIKSFEHSDAQTLLGNTFFGARLMASRFNMLNPITYANMHPEIRKQAVKDIVSWVGTTVGVGVALSQIPGVTVSLNPDDSDFLQIRYKKKVYDLSGGLGVYLRTFLRLTQSVLSNLDSPAYVAKQKQERAGKSFISFFRNKLAPNTSYAVDAVFGSSRPGQEFNPADILKIYPMYIDDVVEAWGDEGVTSLATVLLPNIIGIGYGAYAKRGELETDLDKLTERNRNARFMDYSNMKNWKKGGVPVTDDEFLKYAEKIDEETVKYINELYTNGKYIVDDNNNIVKKKYSELTPDQVNRAIQSHKQTITNDIKDQMFGEPTGKELISDKIKKMKERQLSQMEKKNYSEIMNYKKEEEGAPLTDEEYIKYVKEVDKLLTRDIDKLVKEGADFIDENNTIVHKDLSEMSNDEINKQINRYVNDIEDYVETEMFGEPSRSALRSEKVRRKRERRLMQREKRRRMRGYRESD